jgi:glycosyltransferase involved in cell wall biosynthesis
VGFIIGTAGRLIELKGIEYLLRAAAELRHDFPTLRVEIAGTGPERPKLEEQAQQSGLGEHVRLLGWVEDIPALLRRWDVFVMPSLEEGLGNAALEAMAAGLPVVASSVGGLLEIVEDGTTGWLVPPRDPAALALHLRLLLSNRELRWRMGAAGYSRVRDHFSFAQMVEGFARLYEELLK